MRCLLFLLVLTSAHAAEGTLVVRITESGSGKPLAARISLKDSGGRWHWGKDLAGRDLVYGGSPRVWANGELRITLPTGATEVVVSRPFHHRPFSTTATIVADHATEVAAVLDPVVDLHALGWYGGDIHVHVVHGEKDFAVDVDHVVPIARAEGQDWCSFGQEWTTVQERQPSADELTAICRKNSDADFLCGWGMEHPKGHMGHMAAFPLATSISFAKAAGQTDYRDFMPGRPRDGLLHLEILRGLRAHGSLAAYTHPTREYGGTPESLGNIARELPFDVLAEPGAIEAIDILCDQPRHAADEQLAYFLLDRGLRFAICGFTDVCYDRKDGRERPGDTRTYVHLGDRSAPPTMADIVAAVRARRTFASNGPLVDFTIDGERPGGVLPAGAGARTCRIGAWLALDYDDPRKAVQLETVEVLRNGMPWKRFARSEGATLARLEFNMAEATDAWYVVRVRGSDPGRQVAVTSPIWFETTGYRPPASVESRVSGTVSDADGGAALSGSVRVVECSRGGRREVRSVTFAGGRFTVSCPAACRLEVNVDGYQPRLLSPFVDGGIYDRRFSGIRRADLTSTAFYDAVAAELARVELAIPLTRR
jgi:hypothetical protein